MRVNLSQELLQSELDTHREAFRETARDEAALIGDAFSRLPDQATVEACEEDLFELYRRAHKLAGRGGTFGFAEVSSAAKALENEVDRLVRAGGDVDAAMLNLLRSLIDPVNRAIDAIQ